VGPTAIWNIFRRKENCTTQVESRIPGRPVNGLVTTPTSLPPVPIHTYRQQAKLRFCFHSEYLHFNHKGFILLTYQINEF